MKISFKRAKRSLVDVTNSRSSSATPGNALRKSRSLHQVTANDDDDNDDDYRDLLRLKDFEAHVSDETVSLLDQFLQVCRRVSI